jgi:hypothetical protein
MVCQLPDCEQTIVQKQFYAQASELRVLSDVHMGVIGKYLRNENDTDILILRVKIENIIPLILNFNNSGLR